MIQDEIIKIGDIHLNRINSAMRHINNLFPMTSQIMHSLSEENIAWIDLLINRFGKLQDIIGTKIIDLFLEKQQESNHDLTILDKINKLERLGLIESADLWKEMRRVKNNIAHEYPDHPEIMANQLNRIFSLTPQLLKIYSDLKSRI